MSGYEQAEVETHLQNYEIQMKNYGDIKGKNLPYHAKINILW